MLTKIMSSMRMGDPLLRGEDGEPFPAPYGRRASLNGVVVVDYPRAPTLQDLIERDATLEASERRTKAEVQPVSEAEVMADLAMDVERVAVRELAIVAVGRSVEQHHDTAFRHG